MFNDISCDGKGNEEECVANSKVVSILAKKFGIGQWSFIGPGSEKKWSSMEENSPQGIWDHIAHKMLLEFAESGCPNFRATTPLSSGSRNNWVYFSHNCFCKSAQSVSAEQSQTCVKNANPFTIDQGNFIKWWIKKLLDSVFTTKDTEEQFFSRACREYTLPRDDGSSQRIVANSHKKKC